MQERSLASLQSSLESMKSTAHSLNAELGTALLAQLSMEDQHEVDRLNDEIQELTAKNRKALEERVKVCVPPVTYIAIVYNVCADICLLLNQFEQKLSFCINFLVDDRYAVLVSILPQKEFIVSKIE